MVSDDRGERIQDLLDAYVGFMSGTAPDVRDAALRVAIAAAFGAEAYERHGDMDHSANAMAVAFLQALIDPHHPSLDYLRAESGARFRPPRWPTRKPRWTDTRPSVRLGRKRGTAMLTNDPLNGAHEDWIECVRNGGPVPSVEDEE